MTRRPPQRKDVYTRVTERIISDLEQGHQYMDQALERRAYSRTHQQTVTPQRHALQGNECSLALGRGNGKGLCRAYLDDLQAGLELDAHVRKGEHGSLVVYANSITKTETNDKGEDTEREIPFMKGYTVFNVEQIEGLPAHYYAKPENPLPLSERIENADRFISNTGATIHHGGNRAFYAPSRDAIQLPPFEAFRDKESYYATALHELTHWTRPQEPP